MPGSLERDQFHLHIRQFTTVGAKHICQVPSTDLHCFIFKLKHTLQLTRYNTALHILFVSQGSRHTTKACNLHRECDPLNPLRRDWKIRQPSDFGFYLQSGLGYN